MRKLRRTAAATALLLLVALGIYLTATAHGTWHSGGENLVMTVPAGLETDRIYRKTIAQFEQETPGISVTLIPVSGDYYRKVLVMIAGNTAPDLMWMGQSFAEFADRDIFLDLTGFIRRDRVDLSEYEKTLLDNYRRGECLYALPFGMDFSFLVYNRAMFREAGLPEPGPGWTYPEFLDAARKLVKRDDSGRIVRYGCKGGLDYDVFNAAVFDPKTGRIRCAEPEMLDYFRTNLALAHEERVSDRPEDAQMQGLDPLGYFSQQRVAMMTLYTWELPQMRERFRELDWDITLHPAVKVSSQWGSGHAICVYRGTSNPEAAWKLTQQFQLEEFQQSMSIRMLPARRSVADRCIASGPQRPNPAILAECRKVMRPSARIPHLQELNAVYNRFSDQIWAQQSTPEEAMKACEQELNRRITGFKADAERRKQP